MDSREKSERLKKMMSKLIPQGGLEADRSTLESMSASMGMNEEGLDVLQGSLGQLRSDLDLSQDSMGQLEAIIHRQFRPAIFIVNRTFDRPSAPWEDYAASENRARLEAAIQSIGRIDLPGNTSIPYGGTGFVVGKNLIMTNRHVAELFAMGLGTEQIRWKPGSRAAINFRREIVPTPDEPDLKVVQIVMIHPYWDMAILRVEGLGDSHPYLHLATEDPDSLQGRRVAVIGYPASDSRNAMKLQNEIFGGVYNVKRLQPGLIQERRRIDSFGNRVNALTHDASTLGGNSGSAVIDIGTGKVLGLHFAGLYLDANFAVPTTELARDSRVVDAGVEFDKQIEMTNAWDNRWQVADSMNTESPIHAQTIGSDEGWFGRKPQVATGLGDDPLERAFKFASFASLFEPEFSWKGALTGATASHAVYDDNFKSVRDTWATRLGVERMEFFAVADTHGFVAERGGKVLLAYRGSAEFMNWIRDFTVYSVSTSLGTVHKGFYEGYMQAKEPLVQLLTEFKVAQKQLAIVGHSLGGALAVVARADLAKEYPVVATYTYGQPAVGNKDFADHLAGGVNSIYRLINDRDLVARVPPGYVHVNKGRVLREGGDVTIESMALGGSADQNPPMLVEPPMLNEKEFFELQLACASSTAQEGVLEEGLFDPFSDHKLRGYLEHLLQAGGWETTNGR